MFGIRGETKADFDKVKQAEEKASFENIRHALFSISKAAKKSIKKRKGPSAPGEPPHTRGRGRASIRSAIFVSADKDKQSGIAGPRHSFVGEAGRAHELGEEFEGDQFEKRPFMGRQLDAATPRLAENWHATIGE